VDSQQQISAIKNAPWVAGEFVWTGFDYIGEPTPYGWPARSSYFGIMDLCGFPKDRYYLYRSAWSDAPTVHIMPHWNWNGFEGKNIPVWVYTNADSVELFLNGKSLGAKRYPDDCEMIEGPKPKTANALAPDPNAPPVPKMPSMHLAWSVPYAPGELKAVALKDGKPYAVDVVRTAGAAARLLVEADRTAISGDGSDLSFVKVTLVDKDGNVCPNADNELSFSLTGSAATLAGLDNGDPTNHEAFQGTQHKAFHGLALAVLRSVIGASGAVNLTVSADGLAAVSAKVQVK
jgi:beta-galactosidase